MSNKTITQFITISGLASGDELLIWDVSTSLTRKVAYSALAAGILDTPTIADFTNGQHNHQNAVGGGKLDHGAALNGLTDDDHTQYALLAGRSGGQTLIGGTASGDDITLQSTSNATKGSILFGTSAYDEANERLGIGTASPLPYGKLTAQGTASSANTGPHVQLVTSADNYPVIQLLGYNHDAAGINFDMYFDGSWRAADATGFQLYKAGNKALLRYFNGATPGNTITLGPLAWAVDLSNGRVGIGTDSPSALLDVDGSTRSGYDTDTTSYFGRTAIGYNGASSDEATFAHIDYNSLNNIALTQTSNGSTILNAASGRVIQFQVNGSPTVTIDATDFYPSTDNARDCGTATNRWKDIYATNGTIQTSDERLKTDIVDSDLGLEFINSLRPVRYVWRSTPEKPRTCHHYGVIAQQTKAVLDELGIADFAGYIRDEKHDAYGLRYTEFIAPIIKAIQELNEEIATLRQQLSES